MSITAKIVKDSINSVTNDRLTTFILTYPRFVHSEFLTHRMLSKNSASTRAIPTKKIIQSIIDDPAMPVFWGKNQAGMQAYEELEDLEIKQRYWTNNPELSGKFTDKKYAKFLWLKARDYAVNFVEVLIDLGLHKQIAGRILEPWFNITVLVSGTEWENFFALRAHKDAQPEIRALAEVMLEEYNKSIPSIVEPKCIIGYIGDDIQNKVSVNGDWHIPFEDQMPDGLSKFDQIRVAIARCARLSYLTFDGVMDIEKDFDIYNRLLGSNPIHASPAEHIAFASNESIFCGNFKGWVQFRKLLPQESQIDSRIIKRRIVNGVVV